MPDHGDLTDTPPAVLLGTDTTTHEPVYLPYEARDKGVAIIAKPGKGKSSILEHLIPADLAAGTSGMVIDPHGELTRRVMEYATDEQAERIILLEADSTAPFGLNLLAPRKTDSLEESIAWAADIVVATIKKLYGQADEFLPRLENYLDLAVRTLMPNGGTLAQAPRLFRNEDFRQQCLTNVTDVDVLDDWAQYDLMRKIDQEGRIEAVINRLRRMLGHPLMQGIFGSQETTVPFDEMFYGDSMLLVSLPTEKLSRERCNFVGSLMLAAVEDRIFARSLSGEPQPRIHLYIDEVQRFATSTTKTILEEGRKFNVGLTMAHQTLGQIRDTPVSDAARLVGTLIVMGVTRPDANALAGELPITPRPAWNETIPVEDGTEPVYVFSPTPAQDIYLEPFADAEADLAARTLFCFSPASSSGSEKLKSAGAPPRPGGLVVDDRVKIPARLVDRFLFRAMAGELVTNDLVAEELIEPEVSVTSTYTEARAVFFPLINRSPSEVKRRPHDRSCPRGWVRDRSDLQLPPRGVPTAPRTIRSTCDCNTYTLTQKDMAHNEEVSRLFKEVVPQQLERIRQWLLVYLDDREALRAGTNTAAFKRADSKLIVESDRHYWDDIFTWADPLENSSSGSLKPGKRYPSLIGLSLFEYAGAGEQQKEIQADLEKWRIKFETIDILRQRLRLLVILAEGLERSPLRIQNGEKGPHLSPRLITHAEQSYADAEGEMAAKLVNPPGRFIAHVRLPDSYHQVQLRPPLENDEGGHHRPQPDPTQPDDIRRRSRALYDASEREPTAVPIVAPEQPRPGRVTRRPRPKETEEGMGT